MQGGAFGERALVPVGLLDWPSLSRRWVLFVCNALFGCGLFQGDSLQAGAGVGSHALVPVQVVQAFESGDVIFRRGRDVMSRIVLTADGRSDYSHAGILLRNGRDMVVVHAVPAENMGDTDSVKSESLESFMDYWKTTAIAVYRLKDSPDRERIAGTVAQYARNAAQARIEFDAEFNLADASRLYCTELVWRAYLSAGLDLVEDRFERLSVPMRSGTYIFPSTLLQSPQLTRVYMSSAITR